MSTDTTYQQQTLLSEAFHVSLIVWPGSSEAKRITVTSGRNIAVLLRNSDPLGRLLKMCLVSEQLFSTRCFLTWKVSRTPQSRLIYQLAVSMPRIDESEYGLWPTPTANKHGSNVADPSDLVDSNGCPWRPGQKPHDRRIGRPVTTTLMDFIKFWPTPTVNGSLNPEWVELMMNFPPRWTDPAAPGQPEQTRLRNRPDPWAGGPTDWETGVPRIAAGIPDRGKRLKALGNAALPRLGEFFGSLIVEAHSQQAALGIDPPGAVRLEHDVEVGA